MTTKASAIGPPAGLAVVTVLLGFEAGGYFADTTGWVAAALALALALSALLAGRPPRGLSGPTLVAGAALALLVLWTLLSASWSDAPARALLESNRTLLYLLALLAFAVVPRPARSLQLLPLAIVAAVVVLCGAGLWVRCLPGQWPFALPELGSRMDFPVSYENALGALAAIGVVFALHLASWRGNAAAVRVLAAACLPLLAAALVLTFSRGALAVAVVGVVFYALLGMSRGLLIAALACAPFVLLAGDAAFDADLLGSANPRSAAALDQGEELALLLAAAASGAALLRGLLLVLERRLPPLSRFLPARRAPVVALALVAIALPAAALGAPRLDDLYDSVVSASPREDSGRARERLRDATALTDFRSTSRAKYWQVARDAFADEPILGHGAGTFAWLWARERPTIEDAEEGHSLYFETLAELGLVGGALVLGVLGACLWPFALGLRGPRRELHAAFLAAAVTWGLHAALDWDWEMPVLTLWLFASAGCALAARGSAASMWQQAASRPLARAAIAVAFVLVALTPGAIALSQERLDASTRAFADRDCDLAQREAHSAISVLGARPEGHALLAYCASRRGDHREALVEIQRARGRDPGSWEYAYGLALVRARAGLDPRRAARAALRLNPLEVVTQGAVRRFATDDPRVWRRQARTSVLPLKAPQPTQVPRRR